MRTRQIPLHFPQTLPANWNEYLGAANDIPSEEQLNRKPDTSDETYDNVFRLSIETRALVYATMHAFETTDIPKITFVGQGAFNAVFSLQFQDGFRVAARVSRPQDRITGLFKTVAATVTLAKFHSGLPAPEIYAWNAEDDNPVGAPYMLMEWAQGVELARQWHEFSPETRALVLDNLALYHAGFAKPLPFQEFGSIFFADAPPDAQISYDNPSAYVVGPLLRGPACLHQDGKSPLPQTLPTSLRDLWLELWHREVALIATKFGSDRSTMVVEEDDDFCSEQEAFTLGQLLDLSEDMHTLIQSCTLPSESQSELHSLCFTTTDYAFRNIKMDPNTLKITAFLDWDDTYMMPFLLCSRYPEDICENTEAGDEWTLTGCFSFLPFDEEGEFEEPVVQEVPQTPLVASDPDSDGDEDHSNFEGDTENDGEEGAHESEEDASDCGLEQPDPEPHTYFNIDEYDFTEDIRRQRIQDTRLRRQYEQFLAAHDPRFGIDGFWEMRKDPLKIQHLLLKGWKEWVRESKAKWVKSRAQELRELSALNPT